MRRPTKLVRISDATMEKLRQHIANSQPYLSLSTATSLAVDEWLRAREKTAKEEDAKGAKK